MDYFQNNYYQTNFVLKSFEFIANYNYDDDLKKYLTGDNEKKSYLEKIQNFNNQYNFQSNDNNLKYSMDILKQKNSEL
jgi:hypothetical protein